MNKIIGAIALAAVAMAGSAAFAETAAGAQHDNVRAAWASLDGQEAPSLFDIPTGSTDDATVGRANTQTR